MRIEDYAIIGDTQTSALVGRDGSVDWLCFPRFDSGACFAALLGNPEHGRWRIAPRGAHRRVRRRYRDGTMILETEIAIDVGVVRLIEFMPIRGNNRPDLVRVVEGVHGRVSVELELVVRYDFGSIVPWVRRKGGRLHIVAGPDAVVLASDVTLDVRDGSARGEFVIGEGDRACFTLTWHPSHEPMPESPDAECAAHETYEWWRAWADRARLAAPYEAAALRSLLTLKTLTFGPSGGIVAAPTTSLPEALGGVRNWDYRYCWLRDATFTLQALMHAGYFDEARAWREWLVRTVAGEPAKLQILYGVTGERRIDERELEWLQGYEASAPVRVGNAAVSRRQLDVYGELMDALYVARLAGLDPDDDAWAVQRACLDWLEGHWQQPDEGMWEVRTARRDFTFSKVMAWAAYDRAAKTVEIARGYDGPVARWKAIREEIHTEVCTRGFDRERNTFTQSYRSRELDANLLLVPIIGFLSPDDPRVRGTIVAVERELTTDGFVRRYQTEEHDANVDGLPGREGAFIACSFWLVDALVLAGRRADAAKLFDRLLAIRNDVGLLSEQYDPHARRLVGNFPQAFSHVALINSARNLATEHGPAEQRSQRSR